MSKPLNRIVKAFILVGMAGGGALLVLATKLMLPYFGVPAASAHPGWKFIASYALVVLGIAGAEFIAWTLFSMMRSLDGDPFVRKNVLALRRMGYTALGIMACGLGTLFLESAPLAIVASPPIGMCGLFSLVLAQVFDKAVHIKQENDLTV